MGIKENKLITCRRVYRESILTKAWV